MKTKTLSIITLSLGLATLVAQAQKGLENDPAFLNIDKYIDIQKIVPEVNVNLPKFLLNNMALEFNGGPEDPFAQAGINVSEIIGGIKLIRVMVISDQKPEAAAYLKEASKGIEAELKSKWTVLVNVPDENIGIYATSDEKGEKMAGLALFMNTPGETIIGNIVGEIPLAKIMKMAANLKGGKGMAKIMEVLQGVNQAPAGNSSSDSDKNSGKDGSSSQPKQKATSN